MFVYEEEVPSVCDDAFVFRTLITSLHDHLYDSLKFIPRQPSTSNIFSRSMLRGPTPPCIYEYVRSLYSVC